VRADSMGLKQPLPLDQPDASTSANANALRLVIELNH